MARGRLFLLLLVLLLVEAAGGAGLYVNNKHAGAARTGVPTAAPRKPAAATPTVQSVHNSPRTVVVGHGETFSVRLPDLANKQVTYVVTYPDGSVDKVQVQSDVSGFSQNTIVIQFKPRGQREAISIAVYFDGHVRAFTRFAVQLPVRQPRP
jgi:hypothetical protein